MPIRVSIRECFGSIGSLNGPEPNICSVLIFYLPAKNCFSGSLAVRSPIELVSFVAAEPANLA